jgi:Cd2+/Zn2+-exporting ATPase
MGQDAFATGWIDRQGKRSRQAPQEAAASAVAGADVGVAMGALGSAAAIETADVVLMTDAPRKMAQAIAIARRTRRIVWQNIGLALGVKIVFVGLGAFGMASMWEAVFADMGTALAAVVNATRALGKIQSSF